MTKQSLLLVSLSAVLGLTVGGQALAKTSYLNSVNSTCGTSYGCDLCHVDPRGGGTLNADGRAYRDSGYDETYFCPGSSCTDGDGDQFFAEGGSCGPQDCDDTDASINPNVAEVCSDGVDNDCDGRTDCDDNECSGLPQCAPSSSPEVCDDGIDNDNDGRTDCADKKDCGKDPACSGGGGGPGGDAEVCDDGIDNDGDGRIDCADKKDCGKDPAC